MEKPSALRLKRIRDGKTIFDIARGANVQPSRISLIERGKVKPKAIELRAMQRTLFRILLAGSGEGDALAVVAQNDLIGFAITLDGDTTIASLPREDVQDLVAALGVELGSEPISAAQSSTTLGDAS